jgi:hypothetical protein
VEASKREEGEKDGEFAGIIHFHKLSTKKSADEAGLV